MFPKQHRLNLRQTKLFSRFPHFFQAPTFRLHWQLGKENSPQAAVIVSKKVAPLSVQRHRLKRVCRETITPLFPTLPQHIELVVVITRSTFENRRLTLVEALNTIIQKHENTQSRA